MKEKEEESKLESTAKNAHLKTQHFLFKQFRSKLKFKTLQHDPVHHHSGTEAF